LKGEQELANYVINEKKSAKDSAEDSGRSTAEYLAKIIFVMFVTIISLLILVRYLKRKGIWPL